MRPRVRSEKAQLARDVVLVGLALVSVGIGIYSLRAEPTRSLTLLDVADLLIVAVFWADFVAESRRIGLRRYVRTHWWELPSLIPAPPFVVAAFPAAAFARSVRLLRLARVVSVLLRLRPAGAYVVRLARRARLDAILGAGAAITFLGALVAYAVESPANAAMSSFGQALWFSLNMFTNVAYLDFQPVTPAGRALAAALQVFGMGFIGVFTASLAGAIVREPAPDEV